MVDWYPYHEGYQVFVAYSVILEEIVVIEVCIVNHDFVKRIGSKE